MLVANAVVQKMTPSIFDSIIAIKKLPYLPNIPSASSRAYDIFVQDFMVRDVKFIWYGMTFAQLKNLLIEDKKIHNYPLVDSKS